MQIYVFEHGEAVQVNRTDVLTLGGTFQTAAGIMQAGLDDLIACPGIGPTKIRRWAYNASVAEGFARLAFFGTCRCLPALSCMCHALVITTTNLMCPSVPWDVIGLQCCAQAAFQAQ